MGDMWIRPSNDGREYTSFGGAIDLVTDGGRPAHFLKIIAGSGTITVVTAAGNSRTLTVATGEEITMLVSEISSVSGVTNVRAQWP